MMIDNATGFVRLEVTSVLLVTIDRFAPWWVVEIISLSATREERKSKRFAFNMTVDRRTVSMPVIHARDFTHD